MEVFTFAPEYFGIGVYVNNLLGQMWTRIVMYFYIFSGKNGPKLYEKKPITRRYSEAYLVNAAHDLINHNRSYREAKATYNAPIAEKSLKVTTGGRHSVLSEKGWEDDCELSESSFAHELALWSQRIVLFSWRLSDIKNTLQK